MPRKPLTCKTRLALAIGSIICMPVDAATVIFDAVGDNGQLCTLRDAIVSINNGALEDGCVNVSDNLFGSEDRVVPFFFDQNPTITLTQGDIDVTQNVYLDASELETLTIDGGGNSRIFNISGSIVQIDNAIITGGEQFGAGGAIAISNSIVVLVNSTVSGNSSSGNGGAVSVQNGSLGLFNSSIVDNTASLSGGGVFLNQSAIAMQQSAVSGNSAGTFGGGLVFNNSDGIDGYLEGNTISGNSASTFGGGVATSNGASLTLENSTISGNSAGAYGGGIVSKSNSLMTLNHVTIADNFATNFGGGVFHNSVNANTAITLRNSILSGNRSGLNIGAEIYSNAGNLLSVNDTVLGQSSHNNGATFTITPDITGNLLQNNVVATSDGNRPTSFTQILGPLTGNGGPTFTHQPPFGSPAIGLANSNNCPKRDQAGQSRNVNACDAGAMNGVPDQETCFVIPVGGGGKAVVFCL